MHGCGACMVACMSENNVPFKQDETDKLISITWMRLFKLTNGKPYPDTEICYLPRPCMHCAGHGEHGHSPCVSVCPATATDYSTETGIVSQIYTRCFGCRYCMAACPYHARYFNWWDPVWPEGMEKYLSPNVSPRMRGVVEKCSFCFHRYQQAKDKAYMEGGSELKEERIPDRLHPGLPGRCHHLRGFEQSGSQGASDCSAGSRSPRANPEIPMLSGCWNGSTPIPRCIISPAGNGSDKPGIIIRKMKHKARGHH